MPNSAPTKQLLMPRLLRVKLEHFTLYSAKQKIEIAFSGGAFCLAGANGLGKSTFLAIVNYGLTGIVPDPERKFESVDEFYEFNLGFADDFFDGRVSEDDREKAQVTLEFEVGAQLVHLTRGAFDRSQLRELRIATRNSRDIEFDGTNSNSSARHERYTRFLPPTIGLESFEQFVFLQHFVFTFDERRHLLFWDERVLEQALHLCFGLDTKDAAKADLLARDIEKAASLVRNYQWQATELRKKVQQLETIVGEDASAKELLRLNLEYERLLAECEQAHKLVRKTEQQLEDTSVLFAKTTAEVASRSTEYELAFSEYLRSHAQPEAHPLVKQILSSRKCGLCGTSSDAVISAISAKLKNRACPLCESPLSGNPKNPSQLKQLDAALAKAKGDLATATARRERLLDESRRATAAFNAATAAVDKFEAEHVSFFATAQGKDASAVQRTISGYQEQIQNLLAKKRSQYERRAEKRKELLVLQRRLMGQYSEAEEQFVPIFKELAYSFLGIDLDVQLTSKGGRVFLALSVRGTLRRQTFQLSESQRFFVDIALRMALVTFTSASVKTAFLFIDTPEGSLDIAYESRAGDMFANFVLDGFNLVLTANINTSQLLLSLASHCGKSKMQLYRMTSWTELSRVQIEEEKLFKKAYDGIMASLKRGTKHPSPIHV